MVMEGIFIYYVTQGRPAGCPYHKPTCGGRDEQN